MCGGSGGSLFAFMLKAIGKCLEEYPEFNSMINIKRKTTFSEVDIDIPIEVNADGELYNKQCIIPYAGGPKAVSFAVGSIVKKPVVKNDEIVVREIINITAAFNHDLVDGAPAARLINRLRRYIEHDYRDLI